MKGFNVFLAVLIFLLAATSAIFSFFLFEKRAKLVSGYGTFTAHVTQAVEKLDSNSGTDVAGTVNKAALDHSKDPDLPAVLKNFSEQTAKVVDERDALANALSQVSRTLEQRGLTAEKFMRLDSYSNTVSQLQKYADAYVARNNAILNSVQNSAYQLGAKGVSVTALKSSNYASAYRAMDTRIAFWKRRDSTYASQVRNISSALGGSTPNLSESGYEKGLSDVLTTARKVRSDKDKFYNNWQSGLRTIANLNKVIDKQKQDITNRDLTIKRKDMEILRLCKVLGLEVPRQPMLDGCEDSLNLVKSQQKGKILEVDDKFGFVVISLGKNTRVQEQFGNKVNDVDPQIPQGAVLTVAREMSSGDAEYINKIKITRLDDNASIAEPIDKRTGKRMRVGDTVYFADDEIARLIKNRK